MKDKHARMALDKLADALGFHFGWYEFVPPEVYTNVQHGIEVGIDHKVAQIEAELAAMKEDFKPDCPTCGQKIQNGIQPGDVEKVSAAVRKADKKK
jgi:hypothetical protein